MVTAILLICNTGTITAMSVSKPAWFVNRVAHHFDVFDAGCATLTAVRVNGFTSLRKNMTDFYLSL